MGWAGVVAAGLAAALAMGLLDCLLHFQDRGIRVIASLTVWGVVLWVGYRRLFVPQTARLSNADLARRVQRRFPQLSDSLASAVEFLDQPEDDPRAGSAALRAAVIREVTAASEPLDFLETLGGRPARRAALAASAIGLLTLILVLPNATAAWTAAVRLVNPLGNVAWPQRTHLELRQRIRGLPGDKPSRSRWSIATRSCPTWCGSTIASRRPAAVPARRPRPCTLSAGRWSRGGRTWSALRLSRRGRRRPGDALGPGAGDGAAGGRLAERDARPARLYRLAARPVAKGTCGRWWAPSANLGRRDQAAARAAWLSLEDGRRIAARLARDGTKQTRSPFPPTRGSRC